MKKIVDWPRSYLNRTPMYQVVLYALMGIYVSALLAAALDWLDYGLFEMGVMACVILLTALGVSCLCAVATRVPASHVSSVITALILILLILPSLAPIDLFNAAVITAFAITSKYVIIYKKQHLLNPVAVGLVLGGVLGFGGGAWWVASPILFLPIILGGLLVAAKIRCLDMVAVCVGVAFVYHLLSMWISSASTSELMTTFWFSYPFVFLAFFMLTEPFTMPSRRSARLVYAVLVAVLASLPPLGGVIISPELALIIGNIALAPWGQRQKLLLKLIRVRNVTSSIYECAFPKPEGFRFVAGQYMEWMVPHTPSDSRGTRRYFTIASAPEETELRMAFKLPDKSSTYKNAVVNLTPGDVVIGSQRAGDFVLPAAKDVKLGFIAGGIGVTPFVSQSLSLAANHDVRDIVTLYCVPTEAEMAYREVLEGAGPLVPVVADGKGSSLAESGFLSADIVSRRVPDYAARTWYISGPPVMVRSARGILRQLGVPARRIHEDFFPGLA